MHLLTVEPQMVLHFKALPTPAYKRSFPGMNLLMVSQRFIGAEDLLADRALKGFEGGVGELVLLQAQGGAESLATALTLEVGGQHMVLHVAGECELRFKQLTAHAALKALPDIVQQQVIVQNILPSKALPTNVTTKVPETLDVGQNVPL